MKEIRSSKTLFIYCSFASTLLATVTAVQLTFIAPGWTKVQYDANKLRMKDSDETNELIRQKIRNAQNIQASQSDSGAGPGAEPEAIEELKDALRIALSRPDQDGNRQHAFSRVRRELNDLKAFEATLSDLTKEAVFALESKETPVNIQYTYIVLLENLMAEIKPEVGSNSSFKKVIETIRDAKIKVSDKARQMQRMRSMGQPVSPSEVAEKILPKK